MPTRKVLSAGTLSGDPVSNSEGEDLGKVEDLMIDLESGEVAYAVLSFGGVLGMGEKLFAVPWKALQIDQVNRKFLLNTPKDKLENAPGFNQDNWPDMDSDAFRNDVYGYYAVG